MTTTLLDRLTRRWHILEAGNNRFKASSETAEKKWREEEILTTP
ncbi:hypothetical protein ABIE58_002934 [Roseovarius sp. MBR-78]